MHRTDISYPANEINCNHFRCVLLVLVGVLTISIFYITKNTVKIPISMGIIPYIQLKYVVSIFRVKEVNHETSIKQVASESLNKET
jgi:hypothetical protein